MKSLIKNNNIILLVLSCALFMEHLDSTIISTSIPKMAYFFAINPLSLKIAMTSYLLSLAVFVPISGWIADKYGTKNIFCLALIIFTVSSALCGLSQNIWELVFFRIIQGFGGAIMTPTARLILLKLYPKKELIKVMSYVAIPGLLGPILGPLVGGAISTYLTWQWIFLVNVPIGVVGIFFAIKFIPKINQVTVNKLNLREFILFSFALAGFSFVLSVVNESVIDFKIQLTVLLLSVISSVWYFYYYKKLKNPIWNLSIFKIKSFRITVLGGFFSRIGVGGIPFMLPLLFQIGLHHSPLLSGILVCPMAVAMFITKFFVKKILTYFGFKRVLLMNTILLGLSICSFTLINSNTSYTLIILLVFLNGAFSSLHYSCLNVLAYVDLDTNILSQGTSIVSSIQQLAMSFGVVFGAICLRFFLHYNSLDRLSVTAFRDSFFVLGVATIITAFIFNKLNKMDGVSAI
jgi:EmrB/QacA subfamily drug resistance transporter